MITIKIFCIYVPFWSLTTPTSLGFLLRHQPLVSYHSPWFLTPRQEPLVSYHTHCPGGQKLVFGEQSEVGHVDQHVNKEHG